MKLPSPSTLLMYAASALAPSGGGGIGPVTVTAAGTCEESVFGPPKVIDHGIESLQIKFATCGASFKMPRVTWTIEPAPDGVNTTSVFMSPPDLGEVVLRDERVFDTIKVNGDAVANSSEVAILIRAPKDDLSRVDVEGGSPYLVNIIEGFTDLTSINIRGGDTCTYGDGASCPQCNLYTSDELSDIGPSVIADLSSVKLFKQYSKTLNFTQDFYLTSFGTSIYDLTVTLPLQEDGVGVSLDMNTGRSSIKIKGNIKCDNPGNSPVEARNLCWIKSEPMPGCGDCLTKSSSELIIEGAIISGYFNISAKSPLSVQVSQDGGCDRFAPTIASNGKMGKFECKEGDASIDTAPFPCDGDDVGVMIECGPNPYDKYEGCFCKVPLPERECPPLTDTGIAGCATGAISWVTTFVILAILLQ